MKEMVGRMKVREELMEGVQGREEKWKGIRNGVGNCEVAEGRVGE